MLKENFCQLTVLTVNNGFIVERHLTVDCNLTVDNESTVDNDSTVDSNLTVVLQKSVLLSVTLLASLLLLLQSSLDCQCQVPLGHALSLALHCTTLHCAPVCSVTKCVSRHWLCTASLCYKATKYIPRECTVTDFGTSLNCTVSACILHQC